MIIKGSSRSLSLGPAQMQHLQVKRAIFILEAPGKGFKGHPGVSVVGYMMQRGLLIVHERQSKLLVIYPKPKPWTLSPKP